LPGNFADKGIKRFDRFSDCLPTVWCCAPLVSLRCVWGLKRHWPLAVGESKLEPPGHNANSPATNFTRGFPFSALQAGWRVGLLQHRNLWGQGKTVYEKGLIVSV